MQKVRFLFYFIFFGQKVRRGESKCWDGKIDGWMDGRERKQRKKKKRLLKLFIIIGGNYDRVGG